jgi:hypothetical protein
MSQPWLWRVIKIEESNKFYSYLILTHYYYSAFLHNYTDEFLSFVTLFERLAVKM